MRRVLISALGSAAALLATPALAAAPTIAENNGQLATHINADDKNDGDVNTVYGSTGIAPSDVLFTANTQVRITGGGYALIDDVTGAQDFYQLTINPDLPFTDLDFSIQFATDAYLKVEYSTGGGIFQLLTNPFFQSGNSLKDYLISGNGTVFDAIRLTSVTGANVTTASTINFEKQNSLNLARVPAVPEPATWAMMLLGFGGIGMAMRRKQRRNGALMQVA